MPVGIIAGWGVWDQNWDQVFRLASAPKAFSAGAAL